MRVTLLDAATALALGLFGVVLPFLFGRWTGQQDCRRCAARRNLRMAARAEHAAARLRERASSPEDVRRQAAEDSAALRQLGASW